MNMNEQRNTTSMVVEPPVPTINLVRNRFAKEEFTSLAEIEAMKDGEYPRRFRVAVRVKDYRPKDLRQWIYLFCTACRKP